MLITVPRFFPPHSIELAWCDSFYGGIELGVGFECSGRMMHHGGKDAAA